MKTIYTAFLIMLSFSIFAQVSEETFNAALDFDTNFKSVKRLGNNQYLVFQEATGQHPTDPSLVRTIDLKSVLQNNGDHYLIATEFPSIDPDLVDDLISDNKKMLPDILAHHFGEENVISVETGDDNNIIGTVKVPLKKQKPLGLMGNIVKNHNSMVKAYQGLVNQHQLLYLKKNK